MGTSGGPGKNKGTNGNEAIKMPLRAGNSPWGASLTPKPPALLLPPSAGRMAALPVLAYPRRRGKSGLHGSTVPDNLRRGRPQGQCHRKQTALRSPRAKAGKGERGRKERTASLVKKAERQTP